VLLLECMASKMTDTRTSKLVEYSDGTKKWYLDGKLHRLDRPACEYEDGSKYWYVDGKCH